MNLERENQYFEHERLDSAPKGAGSGEPAAPATGRDLEAEMLSTMVEGEGGEYDAKPRKAPAPPPASPAPRGEEGDPSATPRDAKTRLEEPRRADGHTEYCASLDGGPCTCGAEKAAQAAPEASSPEGPSLSSSPTPASQGAEAGPCPHVVSDKDGTSYCGLAEDVTRGLILKVEGLEARLKATYDTGIAELNRMDGLYKAALERAEKAEALRAVERAPEAPALDLEAVRKDLESHLDEGFVRDYIMPHLEKARKLNPSAPAGLRDAKRVEEAATEFCDWVDLLQEGPVALRYLYEFRRKLRAALQAESSPPLPAGEGSSPVSSELPGGVAHG